jgi:radical SAM-linked protein
MPQSASASISRDISGLAAIRKYCPWQHLHTGVETDFLRQERSRALEEIYTPDCRYNDCQGCGLCDFESIQPIVQDRERFSRPESEAVPPAERGPAKRDRPAHEETHLRYLVNYHRTGRICFLGHLEILRLIFRALRRAGITTNFSKGFNPTPKVSFGPALPVGTESLAEFFIMDIPAPLRSTTEAARLLNEKLPPGLTVQDIVLHSGKIPADIQSVYKITFDRPLTDLERQQAERFMAAEECIVQNRRKGQLREVNIRPLISSVEFSGPDTVHLQVASLSGQPGIKPLEAIQAILAVDEQTALKAIILKTAWRALED